MPKLFTITVGIEEIAVGRVMRLLHNTPGVARVDVEMGTPKKLNGRGGLTSTKIILAHLKQWPATFKDLTKALVEAGKSPKSTGSAIDVLLKKKAIVRDKKNKTYALTARAVS